MYLSAIKDEVFQCSAVIGTRAFVRCYSGTPILFRLPLFPKRRRKSEIMPPGQLLAQVYINGLMNSPLLSWTDGFPYANP